jgi:hypothetical protein
MMASEVKRAAISIFVCIVDGVAGAPSCRGRALSLAVGSASVAVTGMVGEGTAGEMSTFGYTAGGFV